MFSLKNKFTMYFCCMGLLCLRDQAGTFCSFTSKYTRHKIQCALDVLCQGQSFGIQKCQCNCLCKIIRIQSSCNFLLYYAAQTKVTYQAAVRTSLNIVYINRFSDSLLICKKIVFSASFGHSCAFLQIVINSSGLNADKVLCVGCTVSRQYCTSLHMNYGIGTCRKCNG